MKKIKAIAGQTIEDIALEQFSTVAAAWPIALLNGLAFDADLVAGQEIKLPETVSTSTSQVSTPQAVTDTDRKVWVKVTEGQTLEDISIQQYGTALAVMQILADNPNLTVESDLAAGAMLKLPALVQTTTAPPAAPVALPKKERNYTVKVMDGQSMEDIALQEYGTALAIFTLLGHNPDLNLNSELLPGTLIRIKGDAMNQPIYSYYKSEGVKPASGLLILPAGDFNFDYNLDYY